MAPTKVMGKNFAEVWKIVSNDRKNEIPSFGKAPRASSFSDALERNEREESTEPNDPSSGLQSH